MKRILLHLLLCLSTAEGSEDQDLAIALHALEKAAESWQVIEGQALEISATRETTQPHENGRRMTQKADCVTTQEIGGDRILVHYRPLISQWMDGAREYYLEDISIGFDGVRGYTTIEREGGFPDAPIRMSREITLLKKPREFTTIRYDNGLGAFLPFHRIAFQSGMNDPVEFERIVRGDNCTLVASEDEDRVRIELTFGDRSKRYDQHIIELAPGMGFALLSLEQVLGASPEQEQPYTNLIECAQFQPVENGEGLHYPTTCRFRILAVHSDYDTTVKYQSARVRPIVRGEFEVPQPDGWTVYDAATERRWTIGESR